MSWKTDPPTRDQVQYLRRLAERGGETFMWPGTKLAASVEIDRLQERLKK
jgi:Protein of unknown function (DUF3072)